MTNILIHHNKQFQYEYLLQEINKLLNREYTNVAQLEVNPDIHIVKSIDKSMISIAQVKALQKSMIFRPFEENYQLGIIFDSEKLTLEAQNALLKTLEEQADTTIYFLLVDNEQNLAKTIISRGVRHYINGSLHEELPDLQSPEEVPEVLNLDLVEQFNKVEEILEEEKGGDKASIGTMLNQLNSHYSFKMKEAIRNGEGSDSQKYLAILMELEQLTERLSTNTNKRLALENLFLTIHNNEDK